MPELEPLGGAGLEPSEVLMDALAEGFQRFEARGPPDGMNAHALGRAMVHRGEDGEGGTSRSRTKDRSSLKRSKQAKALEMP